MCELGKGVSGNCMYLILIPCSNLLFIGSFHSTELRYQEQGYASNYSYYCCCYAIFSEPKERIWSVDINVHFGGNFIRSGLRNNCWCAAKGTRYTTVKTTFVSCCKRINDLN